MIINQILLFIIAYCWLSRSILILLPKHNYQIYNFNSIKTSIRISFLSFCADAY